MAFYDVLVPIEASPSPQPNAQNSATKKRWVRPGAPLVRPSAPLLRPPRRRGAAELGRCPRGACKRWREPGEEPFEQIESILRPPWGEFESSPFCPTQRWLPPLVSCCDCVCHWHCLHIGLCTLYSAFFNCACNLVQNWNEKCHEPTRSAITKHPSLSSV